MFNIECCPFKLYSFTLVVEGVTEILIFVIYTLISLLDTINETDNIIICFSLYSIPNYSPETFLINSAPRPYG